MTRGHREAGLSLTLIIALLIADKLLFYTHHHEHILTNVHRHGHYALFASHSLASE